MRFKPQATITTRPKLRTGKLKAGQSQFSTSETKVYPTYRTLLRDMDNLYRESVDGVVCVTRSRRGQWGEWLEKWENGKIIHETWM